MATATKKCVNIHLLVIAWFSTLLVITEAFGEKDDSAKVLDKSTMQ